MRRLEGGVGIGAAAAWIALAVVASAPAAAAGTFVERVEIAGTPVRSYAVYLPSSYDGERPHPALVLLDARQGALVPLEIFRPAAERYGWVLLSSWDSFSDGDPWPTVEAARAVHRDASVRYRLDSSRIAIGGFSGTARIATWLARTEPQSWFAVVAAGAGFAETVAPAADLPFGWFATVGSRDFNYREVLGVERELRRLGVPQRVETFDAGHQWPPEALGFEALAWLDLLAMRRQLRPADERLVGELWDPLVARAAAAEAAHDWLGAVRLYRAAATDFAGLRDTTAATTALQRLEAGRELRAAERDDERLAQREQELILAARQALGGLDPKRTTAPQLVGRLGVDRLRKLTRSEDPGEAAMGWRVLAALSGQLGFYLPTAAEQRGERELAELYRATAALVRGGAS